MSEGSLHILLVEDDASVRSAIAGVLRDEGYCVQAVADGQQAVAAFSPEVDLVLADLMMPHMDGQALLHWVMQNHPAVPFILMTAFGTIPQAVEAIKAGATAYLTKPLDPGELLQHVRKALEDKRLRQELARLRAETRQGWHYRHIVGQSRAIWEIFAIIDRAAPVKTTVMIVGESGTGKEMVARALHEGGPRRSGPFMALNCGAIPENLIESTLFGHEKGAFTGAEQKTRGYFQAAHGGTLLLDEIGELPAAMQSKLLRALEEGVVTPVGTPTPQKVDVRIIAATNRDPDQQVRQGTFRQDLYFRLNVVRIELPPLRQRRQDIPLLARHFLDEICRQDGFEPRQMDPSLLKAFETYDWPGNVRELKNTLESLVVLSGRRVLSADDLPDKFHAHGSAAAQSSPAPAVSPQPQASAVRPADLNLQELSRQAILQALASCGGNRTEAARQLGISRRTLHRRLNEFGLRQ